MTQSSEAKSYIDIELPLKKKPQLEVVKGGTSEIPRKIQEKIARKVAACISAGIVASTGGFIALGETGNLPEQVQEWYDQSAGQIRGFFGIEEKDQKPVVVLPLEETPQTTAVETVPSTTETDPETTVEIEKIAVPEIKGQTFSFVFDQESKKYLDEKTKGEVGVWIEDAVKINGEMTSAIALKPEAINKILEENKQRGIFKCPWPFDWQKNKGMEIVELIYNKSRKQETFKKHGIYPPDVIGIKYSEVLDLFAPFDTRESQNGIFVNLPDKKDSNFFSSQPYKNLSLTTNFSYKSESIKDELFGSMQYNFIDWEPFVSLSKLEKAGDQGYLQDILGKITCGELLGNILPKISGFDFLDYNNNENFFENPGKFQGNIAVIDFNDDFTKDSSSFEKMLTYTNKVDQEIPVCIWSEKNGAYQKQN